MVLLLIIGIFLILMGIERVYKVYMWPIGVFNILLGGFLALTATVPNFIDIVHMAA